jgi:hypothetical protein
MALAVPDTWSRAMVFFTPLDGSGHACREEEMAKVSSSRHMREQPQM